MNQLTVEIEQREGIFLVVEQRLCRFREGRGFSSARIHPREQNSWPIVGKNDPRAGENSGLQRAFKPQALKPWRAAGGKVFRESLCCFRERPERGRSACHCVLECFRAD